MHREAFCLLSSVHLLTTNRGCAIENNLNREPPRITFLVTLGGIYLLKNFLNTIILKQGLEHHPKIKRFCTNYLAQ